MRAAGRRGPPRSLVNLVIKFGGAYEVARLARVAAKRLGLPTAKPPRMFKPVPVTRGRGRPPGSKNRFPRVLQSDPRWRRWDHV
jgi:hypothetical protein